MKTKLFILITLMLMCGGCGEWFRQKTPYNIPEQNTQKDIKKAKEIIITSTTTIEKATGEISKEANKITTETTMVQNKVPEEAKAEINPHLKTIKESSIAILKDTTKVNKASAELTSANSLLENAEQKVISTKDFLNAVIRERDKAVIARDKALTDKNSQMQKMLQWLVVSCIVGAGVCVVAFFVFGNKFGLIGAGACILVLTLASFVQVYFTYLAILGGCLLFLLLIGLIWNIIVQRKAFSQVVETVEVAKTGLSEDKKEELFGKNGQTGIMDSIQNPATIKMVSKEKKKMSLWNSIKNKKE